MVGIDLVQGKILELVKSSEEGRKNPIRYVREAVTGLSLEAMREAIESCDSCRVPCRARKTFYLEGRDASLMVVMDYPMGGQPENGDDFFCGAPYVKEFLDRTFLELGADPRQVMYMNTVCGCMGEQGKPRPPTQQEIRNCSTFVKFAVDAVHPPMIILMGNVALNVFRREPISKARGTWTSVHAIPAMATYSPFFLCRIKGQIDESERIGMLRDFRSDIGNAITKYRREWPNSIFFQEGD